MPARGVGCNVLPDSFQIRIVAKDMVMVVAMPEMPIVLRPIFLEHTVPVSRMDRCLEPANDVSWGGSSLSGLRPEAGPQDTVNVIGHHHKLVDRNFREAVWNRSPSIAGERTRL